jgi:membrane fusion protein YbhG
LRRSALIFGIAVLGAVLVTIVWRTSEQPRVAETLASGTIEATEVEVAARIPERIQAVLVKEGERVNKGDLVVRLETSELELQVKAADTRVAIAQGELQDLLAGAREQEINEAEAALDQAKADLKKTAADWERVQTLFDQGEVSKSVRDASQADFANATGRRQRAQENLDLVLAGNRPGRIDVARLQVEAAKSDLEVAKVRRQYAEITAPISGTVLFRSLEPGQVALVGVPILTLGDLENLWVKVYVTDADLGRIAIGQPVQVTTGSSSGKTYPGRIVSIANKAEFTPNNVQTRDERAKLVFAVKIGLQDPDQELKPGMMADVRMELK